MKKLFSLKLIFQLLLLWPTLVMSQTDSRELEIKKPWLGNDLIDVKSYDLDLFVPTIESKILNASLTLKILPLKSSPHIKLNFDSKRILLKSITMGTEKVSFQIIQGLKGSHDLRGEVLKIQAPKVFLANSEVSLKLDYDIVVNDKSSQLGFFLEPNYYGSSILSTRSWPYYARMWLPSNDHPSDTAIFSSHITAPDNYQALSNGILVSVTTSTLPKYPTHKVSRWVSTIERPTYDFSIVLGKFDKTVDNLCFDITNLNDSLLSCNPSLTKIPYAAYIVKDIAKKSEYLKSFQKANESLVWFSSMLGVYSFEKMAFVTAPQPFSMESAGLITSTLPGYSVHEVVHQWFGNGVRIGSWGDLWISEGFTTYLDGLYDEYKTGTDTSCRQETGILNPPSDTDPLNIYDLTPYCKGASALNALRKSLSVIMNENMNSDIVKKVLFTSFRKIYQTYKLRTLTTTELVKHLKIEMPKTLTSAGLKLDKLKVDNLMAEWEKKWLIK